MTTPARPGESPRGVTGQHTHRGMPNGATTQLHLEKPNPDGGLAAPSPDGITSFALGHYCENVDDVLARAVGHGAEVLAPAIDFASGDRFAGVRDPFGIRWSIMSRIEDLSQQESAARIAVWASTRR